METSYSVEYMTSRDFHMDVSAHIEVAAQRVQDRANVSNFMEVIMENKHLFRGRTVLDVGCGLGILSLFAAKAGAARVYAVDCSNVVDYTRRIVVANGYESVIHVIKGKIEEVELPADANVVDIIVCDWMGYTLFFQSTCDAVIYARDKWLRKDGKGIIFPDMAKLFMAALEDGRHKNDRVEWWRDVYGFDMNCLRKFALSEPSFQKVLPQQILSTQFGVKALNLYTATVADLKFRRKYILEVVRAGRMDGIVTYFHVYFSKSHTPKSFGTDPFTTSTRWMQSVFYFDQPVFVNIKDRFYGGIEMYSTAEGSKCDLNNMEVGFEMFSGEPAQINLEVEMRWYLKPRAVVDTTNDIQEIKTREHLTQTSTNTQIRNKTLRSKMLPKHVIKESKPEAVTKLPKRDLSTHYIVLGQEKYPLVVKRTPDRRRNTKHAATG